MHAPHGEFHCNAAVYASARAHKVMNKLHMYVA